MNKDRSLKRYLSNVQNNLELLEQQGLKKTERLITSPQAPNIKLQGENKVLNFCANNYLNLANDSRIINASIEALKQYGYGMASVRPICGTQTTHNELEQLISTFTKNEDTVLYSSCFDANTGLFETILTEQDAIISDSLNHASIIDGTRLAKSARYRYENNDMNSLEDALKKTKSARFRMIATDGVFSMDGTLANLPAICELAQIYDALVMVDDSHGVGVMGELGRGTAHHFNVAEKIHITTGTLGKALGGATGGYTSTSKEIAHWLRQKSRPYLFSNSLAPSIVGASIEALKLLSQGELQQLSLLKNAVYFRNELKRVGFNIPDGIHPIVPIMLGDARLATEMATKMLSKNIFVVGFSYPIVPKNKARIRTQLSTGHSRKDLDYAIEMFHQVGKETGAI